MFTAADILFKICFFQFCRRVNHIYSCYFVPLKTWEDDMQTTLLSRIERSSWRGPLPEWGSSKISRGNWATHLIHRNVMGEEVHTVCSVSELWGSMSIWILPLPDSGRGSQQLLLSRTEYCEFSQAVSKLLRGFGVGLRSSSLHVAMILVWYLKGEP